MMAIRNPWLVSGLLLGIFCRSGLAWPLEAENAGQVEKRDNPQFSNGQPIDGKGKGASILGGTNRQIDLQNPDNLGQQPTDGGVVPILKWSFSSSKTRILSGGWVREQVIQDLPQSHDIAAAQQHLTQGAIRELHWHRVAEWGFVYNGSVIISAVDDAGNWQAETLGFGDIWYFPKGVAHTIQGLEAQNEYLLVFDEADFDRPGTTFNIDDWITHTPRDVLARNLGVNPSIFDNTPSPNPYIVSATVGDDADRTVTGGTKLEVGSKGSWVYRTLEHAGESVPGGGGQFYKIDSTNFPASQTIAATFVTLAPGGLRELHWHPNAEEWLYFHSGNGRATVFTGNANARTFDLTAGDTAAFPDNSGHYIENLSDEEDLVWIEIYKSDRVADISLTQWLALTPPEIAAQTLKVDVSVITALRKEKQILLA